VVSVEVMDNLVATAPAKDLASLASVTSILVHTSILRKHALLLLMLAPTLSVITTVETVLPLLLFVMTTTIAPQRVAIYLQDASSKILTAMTEILAPLILALKPLVVFTQLFLVVFLAIQQLVQLETIVPIMSAIPT